MCCSYVLCVVVVTERDSVGNKWFCDTCGWLIFTDLYYVNLSGRAVATPYLGMTLVFLGYGCFQVSETAIKQTQNLKLM